MSAVPSFMSVREEIEVKRPVLQELCNSIGVRGLRARIRANDWCAVTFIGDINIDESRGYADRFFALEEGLLRTFHRRVDFIDEEGLKNSERYGFSTESVKEEI